MVRRAESSLKPLAGSIRSLCSLANTLGFGEKADPVSKQPDAAALWTEGLAGWLHLEQKLLHQTNWGKQDI